MLRRYMHWLHGQWPAGRVEKLPVVGPDGQSSLAGVRIVGDLAGVPLLKFAADTGARAVQAILREPEFAGREAAGGAAERLARPSPGEARLDLAIVGGGVSGIAAALEAQKVGLAFAVFEAARPFATIADFPKAKPIFTYPSAMTPAGALRLRADVKEDLLQELEAQRQAAGIEPRPARVVRLERRGADFHLLGPDGETLARARRVVVAIGRSGNFRRLGVPGEALDKVYHRLHDPKDWAGKQVLVVGGGDSALEAAIALASTGAHVTLSYRGQDFARPKPENVAMVRALERDPAATVAVQEPTSERVTTAAGSHLRGAAPAGSLRVALGSRLLEIRPESAVLQAAEGAPRTLPNDVVFTMIGRETPLDFFRRSGLAIRGEWRRRDVAALGAFVALCAFVYIWKSGGALTKLFEARGWFPFGIGLRAEASSLAATLAVTLREPGFYYSLAYSACIVLFGIDRMRRRRTPYVRAQTLTLMGFQVVPLFLLPYILLPWAGHGGWFDAGLGKQVADALFPVVEYGHGREYWRAFGFVLAWPLFIWNFFSEQPLGWWLAIGVVQTFVVIPLLVWRWGKGAYCGWVCSCGALAETMGDRHRHKMPHGPRWNRANMLGQVILAAALLLFVLRIVGWTWPGSALGSGATNLYRSLLSGWSVLGVPLNYYKLVDLFLAGIVGTGLYFWFSGRVWCRFACPLAALMHLYARVSRFRIFADKKKCISCNVCTSVCHQGIDVMNFANKGLPMQDPECVRCSACVQMCPTGTLAFGRYDGRRRIVLDVLPASAVRGREG